LIDVRLATEQEMQKLSDYSKAVGGIGFLPGQAIASLLLDDEEVIGYAAVHNACHAAGSYVKEEHRRQGHTYEMRKILDAELKRRGIPVYFALPNNDFERWLFAKYGHVTEHLAQVRQI
jgi:hypothetical protein